jgi:hypothetical protein
MACAAQREGATIMPMLVDTAHITALARTHGTACVQRLAEILHSDDHGAAVAAAHELLARGYGAPKLPLELDADGVHVEVHADTEEPHRPSGKDSAWTG